MAEGGRSSVPGRQLGRVLRELRSGAGLTLDVAARSLRLSPRTVGRVEAGLGGVRGGQVRAMCELYGARPEVATALVGLAGETGSKGWWRPYGVTALDELDLYPGLETRACRLREYHQTMVPALLQTRGYASALLAAPPAVPEPERERLVEARLRRQALLHRSLPAPPRFAVVLSEVVLSTDGLGRAVMSEQLRHLVEVGRLPHVSIRVVPLAAGPHLGTIAGPFVMLDFPPQGMRMTAEAPVVYREWLTGELYLDREQDLAAYERAWASLDALALDEGDSRHLIGKIHGEGLSTR